MVEPARAQISGAVEPGLKRLFASDAFGAWLERLLEQSADP